MKIGSEKCFNVWKITNSYLTKKEYKQPLVTFFKFVLHVVVVMVFMLCGAFVFVSLEEGETLNLQPKIPSTITTTELKKQSVIESDDMKNLNVFYEDRIWKRLETKHQMLIKISIREDIKSDICLAGVNNKKNDRIEKEEDIKSLKEGKKSEPQDRHFLFMKWFYFVTTCTTTIGYGHVHPKTDQGKLFYIFFSIIGIALMMTLLKKCGSIITVVNRKVISVVRYHLFRQKKYVSDELMSAFCMIFMFIVFMLTVTWHDRTIKEASQWSNIDRLYFWIVTFTTVGFGDVHFSLKAEVEHAHELLMYRICGLSFLAAIIDSIQIYTKYRNKQISVRLRKQSEQLLSKIRRKSENGKSNDRRKSDSSTSSKNLGPRKQSGITDWQLDALRSMKRKFSNV